MPFGDACGVVVDPIHVMVEIALTFAPTVNEESK
jgi:hypothetical protein